MLNKWVGSYRNIYKYYLLPWILDIRIRVFLTDKMLKS